MSGVLPSEPPRLVPARMINEVLYCERLMYLEWAQGEFADNYYTVHGRSTHRRVDQKGGGIPGPEGQDEDEAPHVARSLWLSSEELGITGKIDLVESEAGRVMPVEYKRGKRPPLEEGAYLPERAQLCAQVLLLRDHGYQCEEAVIYFAGDRRRVAIEIDAELERTTLQAAARARELAANGELPAPLVDDPRCHGCSLSPLCLPDEVNLLREPTDADQATGEVRRLQPARDDRLPLYVQEQGARVSLAEGRLKVKGRDGDVQEVRITNTSQVCLFGNVQMSTQALRRLMRKGIPVSFFTTGGWFVGRATGNDSNNVELRVAQYAAATKGPFRLALARALIDSKVRNCRTLVRRNSDPPDEVALRTLKGFARKAREVESTESLLGIEGSAARVYFGALGTMLKDELAPAFDFSGRNRRPPKDPVNALLSLAYALLTKEMVHALAAVGLDPQLGYYHQPRFGRPALALDLIEEFRPIIADSVVIGALNNGVIGPDDFHRSTFGVALKDGARKRFIQAYERRMDQLVTHPVFGYRISYRRVMEVQARLLSRVLLGELEQYPTFQTR